MTEAKSGSYHCVYCGESNETVVDPTGGSRQVYVEDCTVCCRPNVLRILIDPENDSISIESEPES
ncbi:MAG: CPXCG motif-containing cysteine-rich protein [Bacteroidota bacterium]